MAFSRIPFKTRVDEEYSIMIDITWKTYQEETSMFSKILLLYNMYNRVSLHYSKMFRQKVSIFLVCNRELNNLPAAYRAFVYEHGIARYIFNYGVHL